MSGKEEKFLQELREEIKVLSDRIKKNEEGLNQSSQRIEELKKDYEKAKGDAIKWIAILGVASIAFLGVTFVQIPGKVKTEVEKQVKVEVEQQVKQRVSPEIITKIQDLTTQINQSATSVEGAANGVKTFKSEVEKDAERIKNIVVAAEENFKEVNGLIGSHLSFVKCGKSYNCSPHDCLTKCMELGMRMATDIEVYAWASAGNDHCAYMWMLDSNYPKESMTVMSAYPMYHNQVSRNCGRENTGDIPRMEGIKKDVSWDTEIRYDCACSNLQIAASVDNQ